MWLCLDLVRFLQLQVYCHNNLELTVIIILGFCSRIWHNRRNCWEFWTSDLVDAVNIFVRLGIWRMPILMQKSAWALVLKTLCRKLRAQGENNFAISGWTLRENIALEKGTLSRESSVQMWVLDKGLWILSYSGFWACCDRRLNFGLWILVSFWFCGHIVTNYLTFQWVHHRREIKKICRDGYEDSICINIESECTILCSNSICGSQGFLTRMVECDSNLTQILKSIGWRRRLTTYNEDNFMAEELDGAGWPWIWWRVSWF